MPGEKIRQMENPNLHSDRNPAVATGNDFPAPPTPISGLNPAEKKTSTLRLVNGYTIRICCQEETTGN